MGDFSVMPDAAAWQVFAQIAVVLMFLGGAKVALRRLGFLPPVPDPAAGARPKPDGNLAKQVAALDRALNDHKLDCERRFVTREDWVPLNSMILGKLEKQGEAIARIEERVCMLGGGK